MNLDELNNKFKGMHIISNEINTCNLTGKLLGKGKIKLRLDDRQEEIVNRRLCETPNLSVKKVEGTN